MSHLLKIQFNQSTLATLLILLFIVPSFLPVVGADSDDESTASGRNTQLDFFFRNPLQLGNSGSSTITNNLYLAPGGHTISADVSAMGTGSGEFWLVLQHKGSSILGFSDVSTVSMGSHTGSGGTTDFTSVSFSWNATTGAGQELRVKIVSSNEPSNLQLNNIQPLGLAFSVENKHYGEVLGNTFPATSLVNSQMTLANAVHLLNVTVTNSGVKTISAQMTIVLRDNLTPATTQTLLSNTLTLEPGSYPASALTVQDSGVLSISLDASGLTGVWNLSATVTFSGTAWSEVAPVNETWVKFSDYNAVVLEPSTLIAEPGESTLLTFIVRNDGVSTDLFTISMTETATPAWTTGFAPDFGPTLSPDSVRLVTVEVNVPADAERSDTNKITLTFTSVNSPTNYQIVASGRVMVGDFFNGSVTLNQGATPKPIIPGQSATFSAVVENTGSVATAFSLSTGLSVNALNWSVEVNPSITPVIASGSSSIVQVFIVSPVMQNPIVLSEHNMAFEQIDVWVQSQPIGGGIPYIDEAPLRVSPSITVDSGLSTEPYTLTAEELDATMTGTVYSKHAELNLRVVHNLPNALIDEELNATITVAKSFTASSSGGFSEASRWDVSISNPLYSGLTPGSSVTTTLNIAGPQSGQYPLAGTFTSIVTVTPIPSATLVAAGLVTVVSTHQYQLIIPSVIRGEFTESGPYDIPVGVDNAIPMNFANLGNDAGSYRLRVVNNLPENWTANFSDADSIISNLTADIADGTIDSGIPNGNITHTQRVTFNVRTDPLAPAGLSQPITVRVEDPISGQLIGDEFVFNVIVGQIFNATLSPTNQTEHMDISEETFTSIYIRNTGNAPADFTIALDTSLAGAVDFEIESPSNSKIFIAAGYEEAIRVKMTANSGANADGFYMATVLVSANNGQIMLSSNIVANISTLHSFSITAPSQMSVTPGMQEQVDFEILNNGNSIETVTIDFTVDNMTLSVGGNAAVGNQVSITQTIGIGESFADQVIVYVPSIGGLTSLTKGDSYDLTITVNNLSSGAPYDGAKRVELLVQPLFIVESNDWPSEMKFRPEADRTWEVTLTNTGNQDVTVYAQYAITRPGLSNLSSDWEMLTETSQIFLERNVPTVHTFTALGTVANPLLTLTADLTLYLLPVNSTIEGTGEFTTQLVMSRFFATEDIGITPEDDDGPVALDMKYTHIPIGNGSDVAYQVELCNAERLRDISALGQNPLNYSWNFTLVETRQDGTTVDHILDLEQECGASSLGPTSRYDLPSQSPWNPSSFTLRADIPARGNMLPGDGWDLTFRLYHPEENSNFTQYTEETFTLVLAVFADPAIVSITSSGEFVEGAESTITVLVRNLGSAKALDTMVYLECDGLIVSTDIDNTPRLFAGSVANGLSQVMIKEFDPGERFSLKWTVTGDTVDWWSQSADVKCTASINASYMVNNVEMNDQEDLKSVVSSWSPGVSNSFIACIICFIVSLILFRLTAQNDNFRLLGIYSGVLGLGFSFHLFNEVWWGFVVLGLSALWIWRVSWSSTEEFRLLHEDYQRARKGVSTLYTDHFDELGKTRRQLSVILAVPVLGMLAIVLGVPPRIPVDQTNLISLVAYVTVIIVGVWILIKRADKTYGSLYGRLTDLEVKSIRLERDLGDPARLFNELAADGLDLDEIFGDVESSRPAKPEGLFSNEEVNEDV